MQLLTKLVQIHFKPSIIFLFKLSISINMQNSTVQRVTEKLMTNIFSSQRIRRCMNFIYLEFQLILSKSHSIIIDVDSAAINQLIWKAIKMRSN